MSKSFRSKKRKTGLVFAIAGVVALFILYGYTAQNYSDPNYPSYSNSYAVESSQTPETLTVVSYNIWFGENIDQAISEIKQIKSQ